MIERTDQRKPLRDGFPFIRISAADHGEILFRIPSLVVTAPLMAAIGEQTELGPQAAASGALIGASWFHETRDLESTRGVTVEDWLAYGGNVYEELHSDGWSPADIVGCAAVLIEQINASVVAHEEATKTADFFVVQPGTSGANNSGSGGPITGTSTPGTA